MKLQYLCSGFDFRVRSHLTKTMFFFCANSYIGSHTTHFWRHKKLCWKHKKICVVVARCERTLNPFLKIFRRNEHWEVRSEVRRLLTADPVVMWTGAGGSSYGLFPVPLQTWNFYQQDENTHFNRPQRSCGKVMFSQASVILFKGGGRPCVAGGMCDGVGSACWGLRAGVCVLGGYAWQGRGACMAGEGACMALRHVWRGACMARGACVAGGPVWQETATAADGTNPTGMHSCWFYFLTMEH